MSGVLTTCPAHFDLLACTYVNRQVSTCNLHISLLHYIYPETLTAVSILYFCVNEGYAIHKVLSRDGASVSEVVAWRGPWGEGFPSMGTLEDMFRKASDRAYLSIGDPLYGEEPGIWRGDRIPVTLTDERRDQ